MKGLAFARECKHHPDALWLSSVCEGVSSKEEAQERFLLFLSNSATDDGSYGVCLALCFASVLFSPTPDALLLRRAADSGCAFAQSLLGRTCCAGGPEMLSLAQKAADQRERDGWHLLGYCWLHGIGLECANTAKAAKNFEIAAALGSVDSLLRLGSIYDGNDPRRFACWGLCADLGTTDYFIYHSTSVVERFRAGEKEFSSCLFAVGACVKRNATTGRLFGMDFQVKEFAVEFHDAQLEACKLAVQAWTRVGIRVGVCKDVRRLIGEMVWKERSFGKYDIQA